MSIEVKSPAFAPGDRIPTKYTRDGDNVSPPVNWDHLPPGTRELALIVDDPDAPTAKPFVHWVAYKIDPAARSLPEGVSRDATPQGAPVHAQGRNSFDNMGWDGPEPPHGHGVHHYHFHVYALDKPLASSGKLEKDNLIASMAGHIIDEGDLVGTYER